MDPAEKQIADDEIKSQMKEWRKSTHKPATTLLISGDRDFLNQVNKLRAAGHRVIIAARSHNCSRELREASNLFWDWRMELLGMTHARPPFFQRVRQGRRY
ncbi:unnamed protein product [Microthlaspi erraticum]|uniref:NYN domain-containing protein n=1 Tax=Microthlaspi erraticum TaxID=1685480 RepID=A0A6D2L6F6_9BRAS|nr:unnamed protein product [Microthlaspi erraticum]